MAVLMSMYFAFNVTSIIKFPWKPPNLLLRSLMCFSGGFYGTKNTE